MHLQPNPARDLVSILYTMAGNTGNAKLVVRDIQGRLVQEFTVGGEQGQVQWALQRMAPGVYTIALLQGDRPLSVERLVVQP
ncbi:MAG: T9SS type A sorting domain-containing protein [Flavobacteriales bacterium]|nr:T9SS type A sorting domain-containing protein [Flavobacteriales bacterium]